MCWVYIQSSYLIQVTGTPTLWLAKSTFFLLYFHIFWPMRWLRLSVYIGATLLQLFMLVSLLHYIYPHNSKARRNLVGSFSIRTSTKGDWVVRSNSFDGPCGWRFTVDIAFCRGIQTSTAPQAQNQSDAHIWHRLSVSSQPPGPAAFS